MAIDTQRLRNRDSIRKQEPSKMELDTELHRRFGCCLSFQKF